MDFPLLVALHLHSNLPIFLECRGAKCKPRVRITLHRWGCCMVLHEPTRIGKLILFAILAPSVFRAATPILAPTIISTADSSSDAKIDLTVLA